MIDRLPGRKYRIRRLAVRQFLLCGLLFGPQINRAFAQPAPDRTNPIGLNVDLNEQSLVNLVDLMRISDATGADSNGWPTSDFSLIFDNRYTFAWSPEITNVDPLKYSTNLVGHYRLSFTGQATVLKATNSRYDSATNTTFADFEIVEPPDGPGSLFVHIPFDRTRRTPDSPLGSGVTNIRLVRSEYSKEPQRVFTDLWLNSIRQYSWAALRCMEIMKTNDYATPGSREAYPYRLMWEGNRALPDTGPLYGKLQPGVHGIVSWERIVTLAQLTHKDLWINIPVNASDDYVDHLANLFKHGNSATGDAGIPSDINLYLEYSNEMWHTLFPQGMWNFQAAQDEVKAGATNLNYDGPAGTQEQWRFRRIAKRTIEIGRQFRKVFADKAERIRPVINNQATGADFDMLQYVAINYGRPSGVLYGISQPAYYSSSDASSVSVILEGEQAASDRNRAGYIGSRTLATYFGLHSLAYEGGPEEKGGADPAIPDRGLPNKFAAARAPEMHDVIMHDLLDNWFSSGGELYMAYSQVNRYSFYGMYGQTEDLTNLATGKWLGEVAAMHAPAPSITAGSRLPEDAGGSVELLENPGTSDKVFSSGGEPWAIFLLNVPARGTYSLVVRGTPKGSTSEVRLMIDNSLAGSAKLPSRSKKESVAKPVKVDLEPGLHSLFVFLDGTDSLTISPAAHLTIARVE
jgi:hypothetical protein